MIINEKKLAKLRRADEHFDEYYGKQGTPERENFEGRTLAYYYAELLKEKRQKDGLTQLQLAERVGKKREYIAALEKGETDMQLSTFFIISNALGLRWQLLV
jgi:ribosome-binding protein aMBF1 (putative translation factor)